MVFGLSDTELSSTETPFVCRSRRGPLLPPFEPFEGPFFAPLVFGEADFLEALLCLDVREPGFFDPERAKLVCLYP